MILLDSSGWLAILTGAPNAPKFRARVDDAGEVFVPTIVVYEVYKIVRREFSVQDGELAAMELQQHEVIDLAPGIALAAADVSLEHGLGMADAIVYATTQLKGATLVTGDADFADLPGVEYIPVEGL